MDGDYGKTTEQEIGEGGAGGNSSRLLLTCLQGLRPEVVPKPCGRGKQMAENQTL